MANYPNPNQQNMMQQQGFMGQQNHPQNQMQMNPGQMNHQMGQGGMGMQQQFHPNQPHPGQQQMNYGNNNMNMNYGQMHPMQQQQQQQMTHPQQQQQPQTQFRQSPILQQQQQIQQSPQQQQRPTTPGSAGSNQMPQNQSPAPHQQQQSQQQQQQQPQQPPQQTQQQQPNNNALTNQLLNNGSTGSGDAAQQQASAQKQLAQQPKELNPASLCRYGQETVQEIVSRTQEVFQLLKTAVPPEGRLSPLDRKPKFQETLKNIRALFKRLRVIYEKIEESFPSVEERNFEETIPYKDEPMDLIPTGDDKKNTEAYRQAIEEYKEMVELVALKNRHLKETIDHLRNLIFDSNLFLSNIK